MARYNKKTSNTHKASVPIRVDGPATTHEGAPAYALDTLSELYTLASTSFFGADTFYETGNERAERLIALVRRVALEDFAWLKDMLTWLRAEGNMRTVALVAAAEAIHERITTPGVARSINHAELVDSVLQRADEPGEFLAYWRWRFDPDCTIDRSMRVPKPVKRGVAKAVLRLYNERSYLKYDSALRSVRMADVLCIVHPHSHASWQNRLFKHMLNASHGADIAPHKHLPVLRNRQALTALPVPDRRALLLGPDATERLREGGMTWEATAGWLQGEMDATAWQSAIPNLGYMALIRNLRNFDKVRIDRSSAAYVAKFLSDPDQVARSRQLPIRMLTAYLNRSSDRWAQPLDEAVNHACRNIPDLPGRTLVLVDTSGSMRTVMYDPQDNDRLENGKRVRDRREDGTQIVRPLRVHVAALFGSALATRCNRVDLWGWANAGQSFRHPVPRGAGVLRTADKLVQRVGHAGHGTDMAAAVRDTYDGHDRVVILSDFQTFPDPLNPPAGWWGVQASQSTSDAVNDAVPPHVPVYGFDTTGYGVTTIKVGTLNRYQMGGLTDATFRQIPQLENHRAARWPWQDSTD